jgi:hypothetical protein
MRKAASPVVVTLILVLIGVATGALLWMLATISGSYVDAGSYMDVIATVVCYENRSMLILSIRSFERAYIDSVIVNGYRYSIGATVFGESRLTADGGKCPCTSCNRGFIDGELVTDRDTYRINVFVVKAFAKPFTATS